MDRSADRWGLAIVLSALGRLQVAEGRPARGAHVLGAVEALCERTGGSVLPSDRRDDDRAVDDARRALGDEAFSAAWAEGRALPLDRVLAEARGS
jgi:hypothetical protein